jgi:hypothetical protein
MRPWSRRAREDARLVPAAGLGCALTAFRIGFADWPPTVGDMTPSLDEGQPR